MASLRRSSRTATRKSYTFAESEDVDEIESTLSSSKKAGKSTKSSATKAAEKKPQTRTATRSRGSVEHRTCPQCDRVFTSCFGKKYHMKQKVCFGPKVIVSSKKQPNFTLEAGSMFQTEQFGIVRVIKDDRETPTAVIDCDIRIKKKRFNSAVSKRRMQTRRIISKFGVSSIVRRRLLLEAYAAGCEQRKDVVFNAWFDNDPRDIPPHKRPKIDEITITSLDDPSMPADSFPDRIVECELAADMRPRIAVASSTSEKRILVGVSSPKSCANVRIYIRRRLLVTPYVKDSQKLYCPKCWKYFNSGPGCTYHMEKKDCCEILTEKKDKIAKYFNEVSTKADALVKRRDYQRGFPFARYFSKAPEPQEGIVEDVTGAPHIIDKRGFRVKIPKGAGKSKNLKEAVEELQSPADVFDTLTTNFHHHSGLMMGPMYPAVWKALEYTKTVVAKKIIKKKKRKRKLSQASKNRGRVETKQTKLNSENVAKKVAVENTTETSNGNNSDASDVTSSKSEAIPLPSIVDVRPLVSEILSHRYPSFKIFYGDHDDKCVLCKQATRSFFTPEQQILQACSFCRRVTHFTCFRTRYTVKSPEPGELFMCHFCIQTIAARRARAEKRRLEKLATKNTDPDDVSDADNSTDNVTNSNKADEPFDAKDAVALMQSTVQDREYECVAMQGRHVIELNELLAEAKSRLSISSRMHTLDQHRFQLVQDYCKDGNSQNESGDEA